MDTFLIPVLVTIYFSGFFLFLMTAVIFYDSLYAIANLIRRRRTSKIFFDLVVGFILALWPIFIALIISRTKIL